MEYKTVMTTCPFCSCGCQMPLEMMEGKIIGIIPEYHVCAVKLESCAETG